jgi:hypothetical protein
MSERRPLVLKLGATALALATTLLSALYVTAHLKNPNAPLRPTVLSASTGTLTLTPSVLPTDGQPVTSTYAS